MGTGFESQLPIVNQRAVDGICDGSCETHSGSTRVCFVSGWGYFSYCDEAVAEDRRRGLNVFEQS